MAFNVFGNPGGAPMGGGGGSNIQNGNDLEYIQTEVGLLDIWEFNASIDTLFRH
jgi:hypothetical protein